MNGPLAELRLRLQELRSRAAEDEPSYQDIAKEATKLTGPGVPPMTKTKAHATINCQVLPKWADVRLVVQVLNGDEKSFLELWRAAKEGETVRDCQGWISAPQDGETVGTRIAVRGGVRNMPPQYHMWVAHRVDRDGLLWPKEPKIIPDENGHFDVYVYEGGSSPRVYVTLLLTTDAANADFERWIDEGRRTGHYPGLRPSPNSYVELASVCLQYDRSKA